MPCIIHLGCQAVPFSVGVQRQLLMWTCLASKHMPPRIALRRLCCVFAPTLCCRRPKPQAADAQPQRQNALRVLLGAAGWAAYFNQSTLLAGLALALLYLTVLSLGFLMTSFLAWQGMSEATISLFRSAGALSGLMATLLFHPLQRWGVGLVGAGSLGVSWQVRGRALLEVCS